MASCVGKGKSKKGDPTIKAAPSKDVNATQVLSIKTNESKGGKSAGSTFANFVRKFSVRSARKELKKKLSKREQKAFDIDSTEMTAHQISFKGITGSGTFGVVYKACYTKDPTSLVAVKRIELDEDSETREMDMHKLCRHPNIVALKQTWTAEIAAEIGEKKKYHIYMVMDYVPACLEDQVQLHSRSCETIPAIMIKVFMFQLFRGLSYIHMMRIMHRDVKPSNCLIDMQTGVLKICDFGCAKRMKKKSIPNRTYICSRYYRAPELVLKNTHNDENIDIWAAACVLAECFRGWPLFPGKSTRHQFGAIADVLGNPTPVELYYLNPKIREVSVKVREAEGTFDEHFPPGTPEPALDLLARMLVYPPHERVPLLSACADPYFDQLRVNVKTLLLPSGKHLPKLFDFTPFELQKADPSVVKRLLPSDQSSSDLCHLDASIKQGSISLSAVANVDSMTTDSESTHSTVDEVFSESESNDVDENDFWDCKKVCIVDTKSKKQG